MNACPQGRNVQLPRGQANPGIFPFQGCVTLRQNATEGWAFPNSLSSNRIVNCLESFMCAINNGVA